MTDAPGMLCWGCASALKDSCLAQRMPAQPPLHRSRGEAVRYQSPMCQFSHAIFQSTAKGHPKRMLMAIGPCWPLTKRRDHGELCGCQRASGLSSSSLEMRGHNSAKSSRHTPGILLLGGVTERGEPLGPWESRKQWARLSCCRNRDCTALTTASREQLSPHLKEVDGLHQHKTSARPVSTQLLHGCTHGCRQQTPPSLFFLIQPPEMWPPVP